MFKLRREAIRSTLATGALYSPPRGNLPILVLMSSRSLQSGSSRPRRFVAGRILCRYALAANESPEVVDRNIYTVDGRHSHADATVNKDCCQHPPGGAAGVWLATPMKADAWMTMIR